MEENGGETGDRVALDNISTWEIRTEKETSGPIWPEERGSCLQIEIEQGTEGEETSRQMIDGK